MAPDESRESEENPFARIPSGVLGCTAVLLAGLGILLLNTKDFAEFGSPIAIFGVIAAWEVIWRKLSRNVRDRPYLGMLGSTISGAIATAVMLGISALVPEATNAGGLAILFAIITVGLAVYTWWIWRTEDR